MTYPGGKSGAGVYQQIINQIPPHRIYVEPFLGGGAILRYKKPAEISIGADVNPMLQPIWSNYSLPGFTYLTTDAVTYLCSTEFPDDTFIYCDPPYLMETRSTQQQIYMFEF
jgi:DNA adenine methylase